jgi:hypothetical protein
MPIGLIGLGMMGAGMASNLLANFVTIRIPRCERLWMWLVADPSPGYTRRCSTQRWQVRP